MDGPAVRRLGRAAGGTTAGRRDHRRRAVRATLRRRSPPFPLLHIEPGRAGLRHLSPAGSKSMTAASTLRAAAAERILVKDGAYGTLIQAECLNEADYRGD